MKIAVNSDIFMVVHNDSNGIHEILLCETKASRKSLHK